MHHLNPDDTPDAIDLDDEELRPALPDGLAVEVSDVQAHLRVDPAAVAAVVRATLVAEGVTRASISVALVNDAAIHALNRRHLNHDWPTDVISFLFSEPHEPSLSAELVVSTETAVAEARFADLPAWNELALYLVHGSLHLCGHDDQDALARDAMRRRETEILTRLGLSHPIAQAADRNMDVGEPERARWTL